MSEINADFNVNLEGTLKNLEALSAGLKTAVQDVKNLNSENQKNVEITTQTANVNKKAAESFKDREKQVAVAKQIATEFEKVNKALDGKAAAKGFENINKEGKKTLTTINEIEKASVDLMKEVAASSGNIKQQQKLVEDFVSALDPEQQAAFFAGVSDGLGEFEQKVDNPIKRLRDLKRELAAVDDPNDPKFVALTMEAAALEDQIGDVRARIKNLASDSKNLDGLVSAAEGITGAFAIGQGAIGLFGDESEALNESLLKVQSAMAILNGLQAVQKTLLDESAAKSLLYANAQKVVAFATGSASTATNAFKTALVASGIGALIVGLGLLAANWDSVKEAVTGTTAAQKLYSDIQKKAIDSYAAEKVSVDQLKREYADANTSVNRRREIIEELQDLSPKYFGNLDAEKTSYDELTKSVDTYVQSLKVQAIEKAALDKLTEIEKGRLESIQSLNEQIATSKEQAATAEDGFFNDKARADADVKFYENLKKTRLEFFDGQQKEIENIIDEQKKALGILDQNAGIAASPTPKELEEQKKRAEEARKNREQQNKQRIEDEKKAAEELKAATEQFYNDLLSLQEKADEERRKLSSPEDRIAEEIALNDELISAQENALRDQIANLKLGAEQRAAAESEIDTYIQSLRAANVQNGEAQLNEIRLKAAQDALASQLSTLSTSEQIDKAKAEQSINAQRDSFATQEEFEKFKASELQRIDLELARKRLQILEAAGDQAGAVQVEQLRTTISNMELELENAKKDAEAAASQQGGFLQSLFGLNDAEFADAKQVLEKAAQDGLALIRQSMDAKIAESERYISQLDKEIDAEQNNLNEQKALQEQGLANSVDTSNKALEELKKNREKALAEQEKLRKRQAALEALQQAGALVTTGVEMFKSQAPKGLIGVALAIGAIGTIFAYIQKIKSQAAQTATKARHGLVGDHLKLITGRRHEQGGERLLDHVEVESDEMVGVLSREATTRYRKQFQSMVMDMNQGKYSPERIGVPVGVEAVSDRDFRNAVSMNNRVIAHRMSADNENASELRAMRGELQEIRSELYNWPKRFSDAEGEVVRMGTTTIRTKKPRE